MDRDSKQKITYVIGYFSMVIVLVSIFLIGDYYKKNIWKQQEQELTIIYSDIAIPLQDNIIYYQKKFLQVDRITLVVVIGFFFVISVFFLWSRKWKKTKEIKKISFLYEQLAEFQKGNFEVIQSNFDLNSSLNEIEEWEKVEEKLRELKFYFSDLKQRLNAEENSTKELITNISHQLKTLIASIRMCHELGKSSELSKEERTEFLETETQEINKMEVLLDELVKLSRLENNMIQLKPEKNSLKQTIIEAVSQIVVKAYEKKIELCVEMEQDIEILYDRKWTVEAIGNVLENAIKYSEPETQIIIRVIDLPNSILVEIEDEGMGVLEEELHEIFQRFFRGKRAKESVKEGAGVGLYLTRYILEQQGAAIIAKRKASKGTIFKIVFPL